MWCSPSKSEKGRQSISGSINFNRQDTFGRTFLDKHAKRVVKKTKDRTGKEVEKAEHDEPMTFKELVHGMKNAEKDSLGR